MECEWCHGSAVDEVPQGPYLHCICRAPGCGHEWDRVPRADEVAALGAQVEELTAERDALRQAAMRLLCAYVAAQTEDGAADPLGCLTKTQAAEDALEDLIPATAWERYHADAARGGGERG